MYYTCTDIQSLHIYIRIYNLYIYIHVQIYNLYTYVDIYTYIYSIHIVIGTDIQSIHIYRERERANICVQLLWAVSLYHVLVVLL